MSARNLFLNCVMTLYKMIQSHPMAVQKRIGSLASDLILGEAKAQRFGVILRDIEPINLETFVKSLLKKGKSEKVSLHIAIPDVDLTEKVLEIQTGLSDTEKSFLTDSEETAVQWRNEHLRTIVVLANKPLTRGASLRDFEFKDDQDAIQLLARQKSEEASTAFLRNFWTALTHNQAPQDFRLQDVVKFTLELEGLPSDDDRGLQLKNFLPTLGLLKDSGIADKNNSSDIAKRLADNLKLLEGIRAADKNEFKRMQSYTNDLKGEDKKLAKQIQRNIKRLAEQIGTQDILQDLNFAESQKVWLGRKTSLDKVADASKPSFRPIQSLTVKAVLDKDEHLLDDFHEAVNQAIERVEDGEREGKLVELSQDAYGSRATLQISQNLLRLVRAGTSQQAWGMIVKVENLTESAILDVDEWGEREYFDFDAETGIGGLIQTFVEAEALNPHLQDLAKEFQKHRSILVEHLPSLTVSPLTTLAAKPEVRQAAQQYLQTYGYLLEAISTNAQDARNASSLAENLFAAVVALETYIFKHEDEVAAVLSPIHPLHLWRWVVASGELVDRNEDFNPVELTAIEETLTTDLHYLTSLHLPEEITKISAIDLGLAGQIGSLPFYKKNPRSLSIDDGVKSIGKLAANLGQMRPFVRPGLRVMLVNPPCPENFVQELIKLVQPDTNPSSQVISGLHLRIRYTAEDAITWLETLDDLNEDTKELIALGQQIGRVSLDVSNQKISHQELEREIDQKPSHLTVVFDPFEVRGGRFKREGTFSLNPWVLSYRYEYDRIQKKVNQIPIADSNVFGSYLQLVGTIEPRLKNQTIAHAANAEESIQHLSKLAESSTWLTIADRHGVPLNNFKIGNTLCVDVRQEKRRVLTTLAHDLEPFEQALSRELRKTFFDASKDTLTSIVTDLVALEPEGILGIGSSSKDGDNTTKAALGKIVVVRSYRRDHPAGLAVSLDTPEARQWLVAGRVVDGSNRKQADLIGLRESEDGGLILDIVEVKTHDAGTLFTVADGIIAGNPVDQVMATYRAVVSIFGGSGESDSESPLVRPRREVLRNHFYQACLRDGEPEFKLHWHALLNDLFDRKVPLKIQAEIIRVQLASVAPSNPATFVTQEGIPIVVRTINAEQVGLTLKERERKSPFQPSELSPQIQQATRSIDVTKLDPLAAFQKLQPTSSSQIFSTHHLKLEDPSVEGSILEEPELPTVKADTTVDAKNKIKTPPPASEILEMPCIVTSKTLSVLLGVARRDNTRRHWEIVKQPNGFFLILGASGSGKTETLKVIANEIHRFGIPCLIFDFHGDVVLEGADDYTLSHGPACTYGINPMELDSNDPADGGVYAQVNILLAMLKACTPSLGHRQWRIIKDTLNEAYERSGINDRDTSSWTRTTPTFSHVLQLLDDQLEDDAISRSQKNIIESAYDAISRVFEHPIFAKQKQISIDDFLARSHRLNLVHLEENIRFVVTDTLLRKIARALKAKGNIPVQPQNDFERFRLFIFVDEAKILSMGGKDRDASSAILNTLATEYRKFGLGMVLASQMSDHFSNETKAQMATRLVLKPFDFAEAKKNAQDVNVTADDLTQLTGSGDGYLRIGSQSSPTRIQITPLADRREG
jgi:hypothetical protein